jgi:hypothetical protein
MYLNIYALQRDENPFFANEMHQMPLQAFCVKSGKELNSAEKLNWKRQRKADTALRALGWDRIIFENQKG